MSAGTENGFQAGCFGDDYVVQNWIVELWVVSGRVVMFNGEATETVLSESDWNGCVHVIVARATPVSDGQFEFCADVPHDWQEFRLAVVFSAGHTLLI